MAIKGEKISLGVFISDMVLRIIEAQRDNGDVKILRVAETELEEPFSASQISRIDPGIFSQAINKLVEQEGMLPGAADLAIDRRMVIEQTVTFDSDIDKPFLLDHLEWEAGQLLISDRDDYNVDFETITPLKTGFERYLVVAMRKQLIQYIQDVFNQSSLTLTSIDLDKISAIKAFKATQNNDGLSVLVNCTQEVYDIMLLYNGNFVTSHELSYKENPIKGSDPIKVVADIYQTYNSLQNQIRDFLDTDSLENVYFFGENFKPDFLNHFEQMNTRQKPVHFNPFTSLPLDLDNKSQELIERYPERFVFCLGMVL